MRKERDDDKIVFHDPTEAEPNKLTAQYGRIVNEDEHFVFLSCGSATIRIGKNSIVKIVQRSGGR